VAKFEQTMLKHFRDEHPDIVQELTDKGELPDALADRIRQVIRDFKPHWQGKQA
jgi:F0F1-type ATP synthase alpha subunit